jgi:hypothetical protein
MRLKATAMGAVAILAVLGAVFAGTASASVTWHFEGKSLEGSETILGGAYESAMTVPGMTTTCENFLYKLTIKNEGGAGKGSLTEMPLYNCSTNTNGVCTVEKIGAEALPWAAHLTTVSSSNYIVMEGVRVGILYGGEECVFNETLVTVKGSAGGVISNEAETATFNASTLKATGTQLLVLSQAIEWVGVFPTEAFEWHRDQPISVS